MPHILALLLAQVFLIATAAAQSTAPDATAPATADTGFNPLWLLIVLALIAVAVWYFMRRRSAGAPTTTTAPPQTGVYDRDKP